MLYTFGDIAINNPPTNWGLRCLWCFLRCVDMNFQLRIWDFTSFRKCIYSLCCSNGLYWVGRGHPWSSYSKSLPSPYRQKSQCGLHQFITQGHPSIRVLFVYHSPSIQEMTQSASCFLKTSPNLLCSGHLLMHHQDLGSRLSLPQALVGKDLQ